MRMCYRLKPSVFDRASFGNRWLSIYMQHTSATIWVRTELFFLFLSTDENLNLILRLQKSKNLLKQTTRSHTSCLQSLNLEKSKSYLFSRVQTIIPLVMHWRLGYCLSGTKTWPWLLGMSTRMSTLTSSNSNATKTTTVVVLASLAVPDSRQGIDSVAESVVRRIWGLSIEHESNSCKYQSVYY